MSKFLMFLGLSLAIFGLFCVNPYAAQSGEASSSPCDDELSPSRHGEMAQQLEDDSMPAIKPGKTGRARIILKATESGKHGAILIPEATLLRQDGTSKDMTPTDGIMREIATAATTPVEGTVGSIPTYSAGGGTGGKDIHAVALGTGEGAGFAVGDYLRVKGQAARDGVYLVDTIATDTLNVFSGQNEMDIQNGDLVEKVTPHQLYQAEIDVSYADLSGAHSSLEVRVDGLAAASRGNKPALSSAADDFYQSNYWPDADSGDFAVVSG